jgi:magnesium transporter
MINIDEAKIIRLLSVVTLLLSPPMLIAGIYGMNFQFMPELSWPLGYAFAVALMGSTIGAAVWYLKRKRWL